MKYIVVDAKDTHYDRYFEYIQSLKSILPPHVFAFASNPGYYDLSNKSSLHDSWLECLEIREVAEQGHRRSEIVLCLQGAYHDRRIRLVYEDVHACSVNASNAKAGLGDLMVHEVRAGERETLIHEMHFANGTIVIECSNFRHGEEFNPCGA